MEHTIKETMLTYRTINAFEKTGRKCMSTADAETVAYCAYVACMSFNDEKRRWRWFWHIFRMRGKYGKYIRYGQHNIPRIFR